MTNLISATLLRGLAGEPSYSRGVDYFDRACVRSLRVREHEVTATVRGSRSYRVELWSEDEELRYSCTCPLYQDTETFCKHCVAVGLAFLDSVHQRNDAEPQKQPKSGRELTAQDIRSDLLARDKEHLVELLLQHAEKNDRLRGQLIMMASKSGKEVDLHSFRKAIEED